MKRPIFISLITFSILLAVCLTESISESWHDFNKVNPMWFFIATAWNGFATAIERAESPIGLITVLLIFIFTTTSKKK